MIKKSKKETSFDELVTKKVKEAEDEKKEKIETFSSVLASQSIPKKGKEISGKIIEISKNVIRVDLGIYGLGVIRGQELWESMDAYGDLKLDDEVKATILELENEDGEMELTFKKLTQEEVWKDLIRRKEKSEIISVKIQGANKGGLLSTVYGIPTFMPTSQLTPEHYPKVEGGDQYQILSKLHKFVGKKMNVRIITADPKEKKLIISEKQAVLDRQKKKLGKIRIGDIVDGKITAVVDFGAFIKFSLPGETDEFEGLIHISELSWKRVDNPGDVVKVGDGVRAEIIGIDNTKITLSIKKLQRDPWKNAVKKYKVGQTVLGEITKVEPFGAFIQLDQDIHGLVHISEFSAKKIGDPKKVLKIGDKKKFKILSIEPEEHRLGLSLRAIEEKKMTPQKSAEDKPIKTEKGGSEATVEKEKKIKPKAKKEKEGKTKEKKKKVLKKKKPTVKKERKK
jgi:small subunit ribosomal protein S1